MRIVSETLNRVKVGAPQSHANLTLYPLFGGPAREPDYATLDEALEQGWLEVGEVSRAGSVPELKVTNRGDRAVLMMDGEELVGAKQNRVLNLTILMPAGTTLVVPVSCVEQGRWSMSAPAMASSRDTLYAGARLSKMMSVSDSYSRTRRPRSDQSALWSALAEKAFDMNVSSPTGAMRDIFEGHAKRVEDYVRAFSAVEGQNGAMFAIGDGLVGFELFEHPDVLRKMLGKVVRSYALDAITAGDGEGAPPEKTAESFLAAVAEGTVQSFPAVGMGEDLRISGPKIAGAALVQNDRLVHLCAFRTDGEGSGRGGRGSRSARVMRASDRMCRRTS